MCTNWHSDLIVLHNMEQKYGNTSYRRVVLVRNSAVASTVTAAANQAPVHLYRQGTRLAAVITVGGAARSRTPLHILALRGSSFQHVPNYLPSPFKEKIRTFASCFILFSCNSLVCSFAIKINSKHLYGTDIQSKKNSSTWRIQKGRERPRH